MSAVPKGSSAVMAQKRPRLSEGEIWQKLELFPTPPFATRTLFEDVLPGIGAAPSNAQNLLDPCAGLGHMSEVLREYSDAVSASDVFAYPNAFRVYGGVDFLDLGGARGAPEADWIITNPPFSTAQAMLTAAIGRARVGVAFLLRLQWLETAGRYNGVFVPTPPTLVAPFAERVGMCEGGWDPECDTATAYAWFIWLKGASPTLPGRFPCFLIPPGRKRALTRDRDRSLAAIAVPGFEPPSRLKRLGRAGPTLL